MQASPTMIDIRAASEGDATRLAPLMRELGYEMSAGRLADKLRALSQSKVDRVWVATADDALVGCIGCHVLELLHVSGAMGRITTLVVASTHQRQGIGARLVATAEGFFRSAACVRVEVTSSEYRVDAHAFYTSRGFAESRKRFTKAL